MTREESKWDRLYSWLNDMRFGIAPDETVTDIDERKQRIAQTDILDEIMEWMLKQEPKTGHWIDDGFYAEGHSHKAFHCSKCGHNILGFKEDLSKFCPDCGYSMVEPQERIEE